MPDFDLSRQFRVYDNMLILFGQNLKTKSHSHHAVEIIISLNELFSIECEGRHMKSKGVIIRHDVAHMISSGNGITAYILIEPEDPLGRALNRVLNSKSLLTLNKKITSEISQHFKKHLHTDHFEADMKQCLEDIFIPFSKHDDETYYLDERIKQIVRHINSSLTGPLNITELTAIACLSESRLIHLFKKEIGIPIRKYVLWRRLRQALRYIEHGNNMSRAAVQSGFTDAAHFNRAFVSIIGVNPSQVI